jgi:hypothetical protein
VIDSYFTVESWTIDDLREWGIIQRHLDHGGLTQAIYRMECYRWRRWRPCW